MRMYCIMAPLNALGAIRASLLFVAHCITLTEYHRRVMYRLISNSYTIVTKRNSSKGINENIGGNIWTGKAYYDDVSNNSKRDMTMVSIHFESEHVNLFGRERTILSTGLFKLDSRMGDTLRGRHNRNWEPFIYNSYYIFKNFIWNFWHVIGNLIET